MRSRLRVAPPVFHGWWIAGAAFAVLFATVGSALYAPPVFLVPLEEHFGWSRAAISGATAAAALVSALASPLAGAWIDRYGTRRVMILGGLGMALAFAGLATIQALWQLYALMVAAALGLSCVAWLPCQTLVSSWFERRRGLAMGVALAGIGFGGLALAPASDLLIARLGWRAAFAALAALIGAVVVTAVVAVVRDRPEDLGLRPDGDPAPPSDDPGDPAFEPPGLPFQAALRTGAFWTLSAAGFLSTFASMSVVTHVVAFLRDAELDRSLAAGTLGLVVGTSVPGRVLLGVVADRVAKHRAMAGALAVHGAGTAVLLGVAAPGALPLFVVLFGLGLGAGAVGMPLLVGELFGLRAFGRILGLVMVSMALGAATGPVLTGAIFDATGSYRLAWQIHVVAFAAAVAGVALLRPPAAPSGGDGPAAG